MNFEKEMQTILKSNNFLVYIFTKEEERLKNTLTKISHDLFRKKIKTWNFIEGYENSNTYQSKQNPLEALETITKENNNEIKVFFLQDFDVFTSDISINRKLKNLSYFLKTSAKFTILSGTTENLPQNLKEHIIEISLPLPNKKEIKQELEHFFCKTNLSLLAQKENISIAYTGFSINKIRYSISKLIINNIPTKNIIKKILKEKEEIVNVNKGLKFYIDNNNEPNLGGLKNLKKWLIIRSTSFTKKASAYGIKMPKGILLVGIQGTGKSLSAKTASQYWKIPLLRLNISKIFAGILGESEKKVESIISTCRQLAPCILWIDEIDKIFNEYANNSDSGTTQRVTNIILTWLSERKDEVFIIATANRIDKFPVEMLRKGRFDEVFFVDLPTFKERLNIFQIHLKKVRPLTWHKYNLYYLSKISQNFSGAEIEQSIIEAMYNSFYAGREFTTLDLINSINKIIPIAISERNKLQKLRQWGHSGKIKIA
uniref:Uncharacterized AAA domain-containing protein ycf46 n=1 Tax=Polysiphonia scopulorum TaxID=257860 RepID=A0A1Z1MHD8_9FLOR|nr:hypothetical protein [Polysiphonia scopulorum]ARW65490.1 hypothetical protein [Polysiphonia scopulorum]